MNQIIHPADVNAGEREERKAFIRLEIDNHQKMLDKTRESQAMYWRRGNDAQAEQRKQVAQKYEKRIRWLNEIMELLEARET